MQQDDIRGQITTLLAAKDPAKLPKVDALLERYTGHEDALLAALQCKYSETDRKPVPASASTSGAPSTTPAGVASSSAPQPTNVNSLTPAPAVAEDRLEPFRRRLRRLYVTHCPAREPFVDHDLRKYPGREEDVIQEAVRRFGPEPPANDTASTQEVVPATTTTTSPTSRSAPTQPQLSHSVTGESASGADRAQLPAALEDSYLTRLTRIYERYAPERVSQAPKHLEKYAGHEEEVIKAAIRHFGPEPTVTAHGDVPLTDKRVSEEVHRQSDAAATMTTATEAPLPTLIERPEPQRTASEREQEADSPGQTRSAAAALPPPSEDLVEVPVSLPAADQHTERTPPRSPPYVHAEEASHAPLQESLEETAAPPSTAREEPEMNSEMNSEIKSETAQEGTTHTFTFLPSPQPVLERNGYDTASELTTMPTVAGEETAITDMPEVVPPALAVSGDTSTPKPPPKPPRTPVKASSKPSPSRSPSSQPAGASSAEQPASEMNAPVGSAQPDAADLDISLKSTVARLFDTLATPTVGEETGAEVALALDGEMCAYLLRVATCTRECSSAPASSTVAACLSEPQFMEVLQRAMAESGVSHASAERRLRRVVAHLRPRDAMAPRSARAHSSEPRCFWCHWCISPSVQDHWRRAWATMSPEHQTLHICFPSSTRVELPITFAHVLRCRRDVFTTRGAAPRHFAVNGVRLTFSTDAVPLELLLCLERAEDAEAIASAFRTYENQSRRALGSQMSPLDSRDSQTKAMRAASSAHALRVPRPLPHAVTVWWCRDGQRASQASKWSLNADGSSVTVAALLDGDVAGSTDHTAFPPLDTVTDVVSDCDYPLPPPTGCSTLTRHAFALALRDQSFVYCCTASRADRHCAVEWVTHCLARQQLLCVPISQW